MQNGSIEALLRSECMQMFRTSFRVATGLGLELIRPEAEQESVIWKARACPLGVLMSGNGGACKKCGNGNGNGSGRKSNGETGMPHEMRCRAGLVTLAVPVMIAGRHEATLAVGPVFVRQQTPTDIRQLCEKMTKWGAEVDQEGVASACGQVSSVTPAHLNAWRDLLKHYADFLSSTASRWIVGRSGQENPGVTKAKEFVSSNNGGNVSLKEVADHVHLNKHYFCRLFKRTTGTTFSQYAMRVRIEKAKQMLLQRGIRVGDVAYATGFESIASFDHMFKRYTGVSPGKFRQGHQLGQTDQAPVRRGKSSCRLVTRSTFAKGRRAAGRKKSNNGGLKLRLLRHMLPATR